MVHNCIYVGWKHTAEKVYKPQRTPKQIEMLCGVVKKCDEKLHPALLPPPFELVVITDV